MLLTHMKLFKGTKKLELHLNIEFRGAVLSTISVNKEKLRNDLSNASL